MEPLLKQNCFCFVFSRVKGLVDKDSCVNIRYFDFSEAFNLVPHNISI